jgi:DNA-directed RNA polymerase subunit alpha
MVFYNNTDGVGKENPETLGECVRAYLNKPVSELELSVRSANALKAAGITTVRELVAHTDLDMLKYRNFGRKSLGELKQVLSEMGLRFGMKLDQ